jgi:hypothetical protein
MNIEGVLQLFFCNDLMPPNHFTPPIVKISTPLVLNRVLDGVGVKMPLKTRWDYLPQTANLKL